MLSDEVRARVDRQVKHLTEAYRQSAAAGYAAEALSLPTFDSQQDFDGCRPEEKGTDFREHNEFSAEVLKGLVKNGVPAVPVVLHYAEFSKWLKGKPITPETRAAFGAFLLSEAARKKD